MSSPSSCRKRKYLQKFCPHCNSYVSKSTYYRHQDERNLLTYSENALDKCHQDLSSENIRDTPHCSTVIKEVESDTQIESSAVENYESEVENDDTQNEDEPEESTLASDVNANDEMEQEHDSEVEDDMEVWSEEEPEDSVFTPADDKMEQDDHIPFITGLLFVLARWKSHFTVSDRAFESVLTILRHVMLILTSILSVEPMRRIAASIPSSLYMFRKRLSMNRDDFAQYVVCPVCSSVYSHENAVLNIHDGRGKIVRKKSAKCSHVDFPGHKHKKLRKQCGALLMKTVIGKGEREFLYPKRTFCYRSISKSLEDMLQRPGFIESCERWREREVKEGMYTDVYDGQIWKQFMYVQGRPFLAEANNMGLMLNVDWFQPYKSIHDSVGVMYLVVMNLPREERFKEENIIVAGIIPGPHEPKKHINGFLNVLVGDLCKLWHGQYLKDSSLMGKQLYRAAILCLASDIPAARKTGGFLGHMATKGCSKCLKDFLRTSDNKVCYAGFNDESWPSRNHRDHCEYAKKARAAENKAEKERIEALYGARYSSLQELPYFDCVRMHIIDPMHNLLEGTAKRVMQVWRETGVISKDGFSALQSRVDAMRIPSHVDSGIPSKLEAAFEGFTASQWKMWVCVYSLFALKDIISEEHYNIWKVFVSATKVLCSRVIQNDDLEDAHRCLKLFCNFFERKYGKEWCTMNMHLHLHLKSCIQDYGPVHGFWCFSFERANGVLGDYHSNNRDSELCMMRKWLTDWQVAGKCSLSDPFFGDIHCFFNGSYQLKAVITSKQLETLSHLSDDSILGNYEYSDNLETLLPPVKKATMSLEENAALLTVFEVMYPSSTIHRVSFHYYYCDRYVLAGDVYSRSDYRTGNSSCVCAKWFSHREITGEPVIDPRASQHPGHIANIWKVFLFVKNHGSLRKAEHVVAQVQWFKEHGDKYFFGLNTSCTVWDTNYEPWSHASFIPMKRISSQCAFCTYKIKFSRFREEIVNVVIPVASAKCV
ncbi:hypothetical protein AMEX_G13841 [Astyanax mexicanus]|uniref:Uncharacterized protein n=1 Tax=Astyanax mexicanus TaxID=7994 RepID=A0A8T2LMR0_ASTMX|nr:hypothetical protein AMEX_G13841 [Astyanax mexicanus]